MAKKTKNNNSKKSDPKNEKAVKPEGVKPGIEDRNANWKGKKSRSWRWV